MVKEYEHAKIKLTTDDILLKIELTLFVDKWDELYEKMQSLIEKIQLGQELLQDVDEYLDKWNIQMLTMDDEEYEKSLVEIQEAIAVRHSYQKTLKEAKEEVKEYCKELKKDWKIVQLVKKYFNLEDTDDEESMIDDEESVEEYLDQTTDEDLDEDYEFEN